MNNTILGIGAHLDDVFIGAGGVLIEAARTGSRIVIVTVVSDFSTRLKTRGDEEATVADLMALSKRYGFEHRVLGYPYHQVDGADMKLKKQLAEIAREVRPSAAFIHAVDDHWPDHSACAKLSFDAVMFTHGLTSDLSQHYCPLVLAYSATPRQTHTFKPDAFYDIGAVMNDYMELILAVDAIAHRKQAETMVKARFKLEEPDAPQLRLSEHGCIRLAEALRCGDLTGCRFAMGFQTIWGEQRGPSPWLNRKGCA